MNWRFSIFAALVVGELAILAFAYQVLTDFTCSQTEAELGCRFLRSLLARALTGILAIGLFITARRQAWIEVLSRSVATTALPLQANPQTAVAQSALVRKVQIRVVDPTGGWMAVHLSGVALLFLPLLTASGPDLNAFFRQALVPWLAGSLLATLGALFWLAPVQRWKRWLVEERYAPLLVLGFAVLIPDMGQLVLPLWDWQVLTLFTFTAVVLVLSIIGVEAQAEARDYLIGVDDFYVMVGQPCSGVEGFVLITCFVGLYGLLFRHELRFPHYWLVVLPLGLMLSWMLNVLRISVLILIGARISPNLAVNGFHSYAGWMFFTLLALALMGVVHATPALHKLPERSAGPRLAEDWLAAHILPFAVFLIVGTIGAALTVHPDLAYPLRVVVVALVLGFFWRSLRAIRWSYDPVAVTLGALVGALWIATQPPASDSARVLLDALSGFGPVALAVWVLFRLLGTALVVPVVEELFFRGYLLAKLDFGGPLGRSFGVLASSALFASLHVRWIEALATGIVFALVIIRRNRLGDAILAHVAANSVIAVWAALQGDWASL